MGVALPNAGGSFVPSVPSTNRITDPQALHSYLQSLNREITRITSALFDNDRAIVNAINSGTSGTFTISSGGSIIVTSGVVITVTS